MTAVSYTTPDGARKHWRAREHRKARQAARGMTWRIGLLFASGSLCFLIGPVPAYESLVGPEATAVTYFVGSLFFTTAAYLSYVQVIREGGHRWFGWTPQYMGFWATAIQLVGTLAFNVMTFAAMFDIPSDAVNRVIWRPDVVGSACFLVSSAIAFAEAGHRWWSWRPNQRDWHITSLNLWGSVFFGFSAIGAYVTEAGTPLDARWANGGTFLGAACFLVGSILMMGEGGTAREDVSSGTDTQGNATTS